MEPATRNSPGESGQSGATALIATRRSGTPQLANEAKSRCPTSAADTGHQYAPPEIRRLRDLTRLRKAQITERARSIQRLEKVLQDAGIKLTSVASHTYSKSARAMLEALLSGVTDPEQLAELAKSRMRAKIPRLREALAFGNPS